VLCETSLGLLKEFGDARGEVVEPSIRMRSL